MKKKGPTHPAGNPPERSPDESKRLIHESSANQEQLAAQNEELRRVQLELARANDRYVELFDSAPIGYLALDESRIIREANLTAAALLGTPRKDLIGKHLSKFLDREAGDAYYLHLMAVQDTDTQQSCELGIRRPDGSLFHGQLETSPYEDSLTGKGLRIVLMDITSRKEAENALLKTNEELERTVLERTTLSRELEKSRDALRKLASELVMAEERERRRIAGILHDDIAQILAAARMRLDMLQGIPSNQEYEKTMKEAKALIVQTLQETRSLMMDIGNPLLVDLGLKAACESLADRLMKRHPVRIHCDVRDSFKSLKMDVKTILYQVVRELLYNVVKHSKARNAHVMISMENGHFRVEVTDDGLGFDPQILGIPTIESGFGLYSMRERLIFLDGSLRIESSQETGTVVTAVLPLERSQAPRNEGEKPHKSESKTK